MTEKRGDIVHLADDGTTTTIANYRNTVRSGGNEQGLLGLAFSPDGDYLYLNYTNSSGATVIAERPMVGETPGAERVVLTIDQPFSNHNGGDLDFGPDGFLYIGMGDGGSANDPLGAGQDLSSLLGAILRIDPRGGEPYGVPADNPYVGDPNARNEIWISGARNPWRLSFDRANGDLWIGDVGQNRWEEIDRLPAPSRGRGANLGWSPIEGPIPASAPLAGTVAPIYAYSHDDGCSVSGGIVARGSGIPALEGAYLFSDFCEGWVRALYRTSSGTEVIDLGLKVRGPVGFGADTTGRVHILSAEGPIYRLAVS